MKVKIIANRHVAPDAGACLIVGQEYPAERVIDLDGHEDLVVEGPHGPVCIETTSIELDDKLEWTELR